MAFFTRRKLDHAIRIDRITANDDVFIIDFLVIDLGPTTLDQAARFTARFGKVGPTEQIKCRDARINFRFRNFDSRKVVGQNAFLKGLARGFCCRKGGFLPTAQLDRFERQDFLGFVNLGPFELFIFGNLLKRQLETDA